MIVGLLASPNTGWFPLSFESDNIELIAIFGLILLLFNLGLEFDQDEFFGNAGRSARLGRHATSPSTWASASSSASGSAGARARRSIIAGMTATSSSAIVTKLLIELRRLANRETPMILGITVVEDIFIAIYLAIVSVVISGETDVVAGRAEARRSRSLFLIAMFSLARWGGRSCRGSCGTKDDELFTILFFGLAVAVRRHRRAARRHRRDRRLPDRPRLRRDAVPRPHRAVRPADARRLRRVLLPELRPRAQPGAVPGRASGRCSSRSCMTIVLNIGAGQFVAWLNKLGPQAGINAAAILQNRGEFALILATLSPAAGLDDAPAALRRSLRADHGDHRPGARRQLRAHRRRAAALAEESRARRAETRRRERDARHARRSP